MAPFPEHQRATQALIDPYADVAERWAQAKRIMESARETAARIDQELKAAVQNEIEAWACLAHASGRQRVDEATPAPGHRTLEEIYAAQARGAVR